MFKKCNHKDHLIQNEATKNTDFICSIRKTQYRGNHPIIPCKEVLHMTCHAACTEQESTKEHVHIYHDLSHCLGGV